MKSNINHIFGVTLKKTFTKISKIFTYISFFLSFFFKHWILFELICDYRCEVGAQIHFYLNIDAQYFQDHLIK